MSSDRGTRVLLVIASLVIVTAGLRAAAPILQPLLLALFLAVLSVPLLDWLIRHGVRTGIAVLATVIADVALLTVLGLLITGAVNEFARTAPAYLEQLVEKVKAMLTVVEVRGIRLADWVAIEPIDPHQFVDVAGGILGGTVKGVASAISTVTLVTVALIFALYELVIFPGKLRAAVGAADPSRYFIRAKREIQRYLGIKTAISVGTGLIVGGWVALLGVDFPLLWGLVAFLFNYIPVLGPIIAAVPAVLVTLVQYGWVRALVLALGYLVIKVVIGDLVEPHLMGRRFGLSTLVVLLSLLFWGWLWGPLGMLLSVPLTMVVKIALENIPTTRWVAVLLGPRVEGEQVGSEPVANQEPDERDDRRLAAR